MSTEQFQPGDERRLLLVDDLSRTQIVQYAGASGDFNPIHTDEVFATQVSNYPSVIAHGMLTMGMSARLFTDWFGDGQLVDLGRASSVRCAQATVFRQWAPSSTPARPKRAGSSTPACSRRTRTGSTSCRRPPPRGSRADSPMDVSSGDAAPWDLAPSATYVEGLRRGELRFLRCDECRQACFYPRVLCPHCGATTLHWEQSDGGGVVYSVTEVSPKDGDPYNITLVDIDEGFRLLTTVIDAMPIIGTRVQFAPEASSEEFSDAGPRPAFRAVGDDRT